MDAVTRWERNLPINLSQLATVQGVSYSVVKNWAKDPVFPRVGNFLRRTEFEAWWRKAARRPSAGRPQPPAADTPHAQPSNCDSPAAWPPQAARLRDAAGSHS